MSAPVRHRVYAMRVGGVYPLYVAKAEKKGRTKGEVDEIILVDDSAIIRAIRLLWRTTHNMAEGAGAIATAAVIERRADFAGQTVVSILCGGNLATDSLARIFAR